MIVFLRRNVELKKNNVIALVVHICICLTLSIVYSQLNYMDFRGIPYERFTVNIFLFLMIAVLYILSGYFIITKFSKLNLTGVKKILSVSSVGFIGLFIWLCTMIYITFSNESWAELHWIWFHGYNYSIMPLVNALKSIIGFIDYRWLVIISFVPTILMWIGYEIKNDKGTKKLSN